MITEADNFMITEADNFGLQYCIVSTKPRMLLIGMDVGETGFKSFADGTTSLSHLSEIVGQNGHIFINPWWSITDSDSWKTRLESITELTRASNSPGINFFCNAEIEVRLLRERGLTATLMNHNTFCNEDIFRPLAETKRFKAIYNAKMTPFKRHELARHVEGLALIYSKFGDLSGYFPRVLATLKTATFLNGDPRDQTYKMFDSNEVCRHLNQAEVGLCLSNREGAMYASIEYLLCGLPVVSTVSVGGRDTFFDDRYCLIVPDDADAVSSAVLELSSRAIDPKTIRQETLAKVLSFRKKLIELIDKLQISGGFRPCGESSVRQMMLSSWACWTYGTISAIRRRFELSE